MGGVRDGRANFKFFDVIGPRSTIGVQAITGATVDKQGYETLTFVFAMNADVSGTVSGVYPSTLSGYFLRMQHAVSNAAGALVWSNCVASQMLVDVTISGQLSGASDTSWAWMHKNSIGSGIEEGVCMHFGVIPADLSYIESKWWAAGYRGTRRWVRVILSTSAAADVSAIGFACLAILGLEANWPINEVKLSGPPAAE